MLEYTGAVVVIGDAQKIEFQQAEHLIVCEDCRRVKAGERAKIAEIDYAALGEPVEPLAAE